MERKGKQNYMQYRIHVTLPAENTGCSCDPSSAFVLAAFHPPLDSMAFATFVLNFCYNLISSFFLWRSNVMQLATVVTITTINELCFQWNSIQNETVWIRSNISRFLFSFIFLFSSIGFCPEGVPAVAVPNQMKEDGMNEKPKYKRRFNFEIQIKIYSFME